MQLPDVIDRVRPSIVQIRSVGPKLPPQGRTIGTGFIVTSEQHIATAYHVVDAIKPADGETLRVAFAGPNVDTPNLKMHTNFAQFDGRVVATNADLDLALVHVPTHIRSAFRVEFGGLPLQENPAPVKFYTGKIREGMELAVSGYPLDEPSLITNAGILASTFSPNMQEEKATRCYLGDFTANPGNSGGPVYAARDGSVIGVCIAYKLAPVIGGNGAHNAGLTVTVPIEYIVDALTEQGLRPSQIPASTPHPSQKKRRK